MKPSILVIDDEKVQSIVLRKAIEMAHPEYYVESAWEEVDMLAKIENIYYHIAVIDLQMDDFKETDGLVLIHKILKINPLAKIIIISSYLSAYDKQTAEIFQTGRIIAMVDKSMEDRAFNNTIINAINTELEKQQNDSDIIKQILTNAYADAKNETNPQEKGRKFEYFVATLFGNIGFKNMQRNVIDKSRNEIDIIIRNEIDDLFFQKFKPYILIECKNEQEKPDKNTFIQFYTKLENTASMSNLGFLITSAAGMKDTAYKEAMRSSKQQCKVIFITQIEIMRLLQAQNMLDMLKTIIDEQVKDN